MWTGPQPRPPLRPGDYNWVAERYLVSYHPPQGELNPDRAIEWVVGKSGALDASTAEPSRAESQREKFIPSALLAPPTAPPTAAPVRSRTRRARARPSGTCSQPAVRCEQEAAPDAAATISFEGHSLQVVKCDPPRLAIRDLIALMCDMDASDKGLLHIRSSFFDRGFAPRLACRFDGTPISPFRAGTNHCRVY